MKNDSTMLQDKSLWPPVMTHESSQVRVSKIQVLTHCMEQGFWHRLASYACLLLEHNSTTEPLLNLKSSFVRLKRVVNFAHRHTEKLTNNSEAVITRPVREPPPGIRLEGAHDMTHIKH